MIEKYVTLIFILINCRQVELLKEGDACSAKGIEGTCQLQTRCNTTLEYFLKGITPEVCTYSGLTPVICCTDLKIADRNNVSRIVDVTNNEFKYRGRNKAEVKCNEYRNKILKCFVPKDKITYDPELPPVYLCRSGLASGTYVVDPHEYPHMAGLGYGNETYKEWLCGGSLISENYVLTAAHCLHSHLGQVKYIGLGSTIIRNGEFFYDIFKNNSKFDVKPFRFQSQKIYDVIERIPHPEYKPPSLYNDIALLKLSKNVEFGRNIQPACIETKTVTPDALIATGWGLTEHYETSDILQEITLEPFNHSECRNMYRGTSRRRLADGIKNSQVCYGSRTGYHDTCQGDSGGPLFYSEMIEFPNCCEEVYQHTIFGITSFGKQPCGNIGIPGVYTKVQSYNEWISNIVWPNVR